MHQPLSWAQHTQVCPSLPLASHPAHQTAAAWVSSDHKKSEKPWFLSYALIGICRLGRHQTKRSHPLLLKVFIGSKAERDFREHLIQSPDFNVSNVPGMVLCPAGQQGVNPGAELTLPEHPQSHGRGQTSPKMTQIKTKI